MTEREIFPFNGNEPLTTVQVYEEMTCGQLYDTIFEKLFVSEVVHRIVDPSQIVIWPAARSPDLSDLAESPPQADFDPEV